MARLRNKLKGSTLIESLVAMILLSTAIMLAFLSLTSIRKTFNNDLKTYAFLILNKYLDDKDSLIKETDVISHPLFDIIISKKAFNYNPILTQISVKAITKDSVILCELKKVTKQRTSEKAYNIDEKN